jgi:tetratricopeptide (TPR) repeat protein
MLLADGDADAAIVHLDESLRIFRELEESLDLAETLRCLAGAHAARGRHEVARNASEEAREILAELGREF